MASWTEITAVAQIIYQRAEIARINKKQAEQLVERIRLLIASVMDAGLADHSDYTLQQEGLHNTLTEALRLVSDFQAENWLSHFIRAGGWKENIANIHGRLTSHAQAFHIALEVNHAKNQIAMLEDLDDLKNFVIEILREQYHTREELESSAEILLFLKQSLIQQEIGQVALLNIIDDLRNSLNRVANFPTIEVTVIQKGAKVGHVEHTTATAAYSLKTGGGAPDQATQDAFKSFMSFGSTLATSKTNIKVTVVESGAEVNSVVENTVGFLLSLDVSHSILPVSNTTASGLQAPNSHFGGRAAVVSNRAEGEAKTDFTKGP